MLTWCNLTELSSCTGIFWQTADSIRFLNETLKLYTPRMEWNGAYCFCTVFSVCHQHITSYIWHVHSIYDVSDGKVYKCCLK